MSKSTAGGAGGGVGRRSAAPSEPYSEANDYFEATQLGQTLGGPYTAWAQPGDEREAVDDYAESGYWSINQHLRVGDLFPISPERLKSIAELDKLMETASLPQNVIAWRGVRKSFFGQFAGLQPEELVGRTFQDKGFTSTALSRAETAQFAEAALFRVKIPKGTQARYISKLETELLLHRGHTFRFSKFLGTEDTGRLMYELEIVGRG